MDEISWLRHRVADLESALAALTGAASAAARVLDRGVVRTEQNLAGGFVQVGVPFDHCTGRLGFVDDRLVPKDAGQAPGWNS